MTDHQPRVLRGVPAGGRFAAQQRPESPMRLVQPLSEFEAHRLRKLLERARNGFGDPLIPDSVHRIAAFASDPVEEKWMSARSIIVGGTMHTTLWHATMKHAGLVKNDDGSWPVPTREQLMTALDAGTKSPPTYPA